MLVSSDVSIHLDNSITTSCLVHAYALLLDTIEVFYLYDTYFVQHSGYTQLCLMVICQRLYV